MPHVGLKFLLENFFFKFSTWIRSPEAIWTCSWASEQELGVRAVLIETAQYSITLARV